MPRPARKDTGQLDLAAAGAVLQRAILRQEPTVSGWVHKHTRMDNGVEMGVNTVLMLCRGTYNPGSGPSVQLLKRISEHLYPGDVTRQQIWTREYCEAARLIPHKSETLLLPTLKEIQVDIRELELHARRIGKKK